jgi:hypothetical protein
MSQSRIRRVAEALTLALAAAHSYNCVNQATKRRDFAANWAGGVNAPVR